MQEELNHLPPLVCIRLLTFGKKLKAMKGAKHLFFASVVAIAWSCGGPTPQQGNQNNGADTTAQTTPDTPAPRASHDCKVTNKMLENNSVWIRSQEVLVAVTADAETFDENYGDSYRVLEVYDTRTCNLIERKVLPVNVSPDFPYYVAEINYNNIHQMAAVKGFKSVYLYDAENRKWLPELQPEFASTRYGGDARAGMIHRLEVWEDYLLGYSQDFGAFVFDLSNKNQPASVLPYAEFKVSENDFRSLFLLSSQGANQAIAPSYDANTGTFTVNPLFSEPLQLKTETQRRALNNRYLVLRKSDSSNAAVAIDVEKRKRIELPADVAAKTTQEVLAWIRQNQR